MLVGKGIGAFYAMIPFGTAVGFAYGSVIASTKHGWPLAYFLEV